MTPRARCPLCKRYAPAQGKCKCQAASRLVRLWRIEKPQRLPEVVVDAGEDAQDITTYLNEHFGSVPHETL